MNSAILDVAIGIVFFYASLSLACTTITEYISRRARLRAKKLEQGVAALLGTKGADSVMGDVVDRILTHPIVAPKGLQDKRSRPTEIAPKAFAAAVFDIVSEGRATKTLADLEASVHKLPDGAAKTALLTVIDAADDNLERAREIVAAWFDGGMKWVSGWYKRSVQLITRWSAVILVLALNADTTVLVQTLWTDQAVRESIAGAADKALPQAPAEVSSAAAPPNQFKELKRQAQDALHPFPLGWSFDADDIRTPRNWHLGGAARFWGVLLKLLGFYITVVALAVGGPFWFDILKRMVNLRSEIKGPRPRQRP